MAVLKNVLVIDLEATCWRGSPPEGQVNEIIEIGLVLLPTSLASQGMKRSILVKPQHSEISEFCTELTGITQEAVDLSGVDFPEACSILMDDYKSHRVPWGSWGNYDRLQFMENCKGIDCNIDNTSSDSWFILFFP